MACHGLQKGLPYVLEPSPLPVNRTIHGCWNFLAGGESWGGYVLSCPGKVKKQFPGQSSTSVIPLSFRDSCRILRGLIPQKWKIANGSLWKSEFWHFRGLVRFLR